MVVHLTAPQTAAYSSPLRQRAIKLDLLSQGKTVLSGMRTLPDNAGTVQVSSTAAQRRSANFNLLDKNGDLVPTGPSSPLAPYGNEIRAQLGLRILGVPFYVPVGVFRIDIANPSYSGANVGVALTCPDRSAVIANAKYTDYTQIAATDGASAILSIVSPAFQSWWPPVNFVTVSQQLTAQTFSPGDDRWAAAQNIAAQIGCLLYFDPFGVLTLVPVTNPQTAQVAWTFQPGDLVTAQAGQTLDRTGAYNIIVAQAQGSNVTTPLQAVASDMDPTSPTYISGPFGPAVNVVQSETLTTLTDLQTYAAAQLQLTKGATQTATLSSLVLPQLDAFDVIAANFSKVGLVGKYVIDQLSVPLGTGQMSLTTRSILV